jgi:hypothetical protein
MPGFGEGSPFGQAQPTDLSAMLQAVFNPAPAPDQMQFQRRQPAENQFIDLGAGGPPPGTPRGNFLSSLGGIAQQVAPMVGGAMSEGGANPTTQGAGGWSGSSAQLPGSTMTAPQLGPATSFTTPTINTSLSPSTPRPLFSFGG